jgi:hypothetical protein
LADDALDAIAGTYGTVDGRYASREFCRAVFNGNPHGYSHHAFVRDGEQVVGHYAVVPVRVRARGATLISGKGEALFLAEPYRARSLPLPGGAVPAGIALMSALHDHAGAAGIALLHNITSREIGMMQRMQGFRALHVTLDQRHFLIRPGELSAVRQAPARAYAARALSLAQRALLALARTLPSPAVDVEAPVNAERHSAALAAAGGDRVAWTISWDPETLAWLARLGRLKVVSIADRPDQFAVVSSGDIGEVVLWHVPPTAAGSGLAILRALVGRSARDGGHVVSVTRRVAAGAGPSLKLTLGALGFVPQRIPLTIYVKADDDFFMRSENLHFTRMFHL